MILRTNNRRNYPTNKGGFTIDVIFVKSHENIGLKNVVSYFSYHYLIINLLTLMNKLMTMSSKKTQVIRI